MKSAVIVFPGSNCDRDLAVAFSEISGRETHMVWHGDSDLPDGIDVIGVPGGFSYGDYLRSSAMAARSPIMRRSEERRVGTECDSKDRSRGSPYQSQKKKHE